MMAALGLPGKTIAVGLDHTRLFLRNLVLEWRLAEARQNARERQCQHAKTLADHVAALDLLGQLTRRRQESEVLAGMEDLFRMLFAPTVYHYLPSAEADAPDLPGEIRESLQTLDQAFAWTANQSGFVLRLVRAQQCLGFIYVDEFQFPQFKEQYLNLALTMIDVCNLSLESVRTRKRLIEAEKMASLGAMVAGIAHEINTPVGVGVLAASTLQHQTQELTGRFTQRSMTQSDLRGYLEASSAGTELISSSLRRVGKLIASFRRVAVNGHRQTVQAIGIADCLKETLASFGDRLLKGQYQVQVNCPDSIIVQGYPGDLESVFTNLVANSLQHGFKGRTHGSIHITVAQQESTIHMAYADDGNGLSDEASKRIFDPFFTTDMQNGMGLGMHLVYNLITQRMGGGISVDPSCSTGIRFLMEVPTQAV
jgi:C4-dicarboxylate-specific signal transduction histidine kinase